MEYVNYHPFNMEQTKRKNDVAFGDEGERKVLKYLNHSKRFNKTLYKTKDTYHTYDFINDDYICELKSRRSASDKYCSAMCGLNKITEITKFPDKKLRFYWLFTDGLYYWDYKKNNALDWENNQWYSALGGRFDRGYKEEIMCCYVRYKYLQKVTGKVKATLG